jgi:hypothetical protein
MKKVVMTGRYEFHGKGSDLYKAIILAHQLMPKGFVDISAIDFLENAEDFSYEAEWIEKEIESQFS